MDIRDKLSPILRDCLDNGTVTEDDVLQALQDGRAKTIKLAKDSTRRRSFENIADARDLEEINKRLEIIELASAKLEETVRKWTLKLLSKTTTSEGL